MNSPAPRHSIFGPSIYTRIASLQIVRDDPEPEPTLPDIPVMIAPGKNLRGLVTFRGFENEPVGLGKDDQPIKLGFQRTSLATLFAENSRRDSHVCVYTIEKDGVPLDRIPRLRKDSLDQVRAAGFDVVCRSVWIDLDLKDLVGRSGQADPPKLLWWELTDDEKRIVWERIESARASLKAKGTPWNALYTTRGGFRFVHVLAVAVPAGAGFEGLVSRFLASYTAAGLPVDQACKDWTRLFRAPRVTLENGLQTWGEDWFTTEVQGEEDDTYMPTAADLVPAPVSAAPAVEIERVSGTMPDPVACQELVAGPAGDRARAELADDALAPWLFQGLPLAFEGNRHTTLARAIGALVGTLHAKEWASPELLFGLLLDPVAQFRADDGEDWHAKAWEMVGSFWTRDRQKSAVAALAPAPVPAPRSGSLRSVGPWILEESDVPAVVEDLIYERELVMAYGAPGSGKTLVVLDAALSLALGLPKWAGYELPEGGRQVVYVSAEGSRGMRKRIRAWAKAHGKGDVLDVLRRLDGRFFLFEKAVGLLNDDEWSAFREEVDGDDNLAPRLFVFDTLSRCIAGADENSAKEMTVAVEKLGELARETGAAVVVVHHSAKNATAERGSSVWAGAVDVKFRVAQDAGKIVVDFDKMKDGELPTGGLGFRIEQVDLGKNTKGKTQTSAVARFEPSRADGVSPSMLNMLRGLAKLGPAGTLSTEPEWRKALGLPPSRGGRFAQDVRGMVERGLLAEPDTTQKAHRYSIAGYGWRLLHDGDA